jgi:hypothetical protein
VSSSRWAGKGKSETICSQCCGEQREASIDCPAHCTYLQAAHRYEAQRKTPPEELAFPKVKVNQGFLEDRQPLLAGLALTIVGFAKDSAVRDGEALTALDALARSYQTLDSGLYYEQQAETPKAQGLATAMSEFLQKYSQEQQQRFGGSLRPSEALQALVFLRRLGQLEGNERPLSRRYLEFLRRSLPAEAKTASESKLIIPGA